MFQLTLALAPFEVKVEAEHVAKLKKSFVSHYSTGMEVIKDAMLVDRSQQVVRFSISIE